MQVGYHDRPQRRHRGCRTGRLLCRRRPAAQPAGCEDRPRRSPADALWAGARWCGSGPPGHEEHRAAVRANSDSVRCALRRQRPPSAGT
ncbi:MAG: hypothetical protein MZW92_52715 [Comamonadaceae bacterium]|nr:hypothetical protein [Comamonadaceae bacterium]